jgi:serine/threonine protein kinase
MSVLVGSHLGPYEIVGRIGAGGMGEVYRAKDTRLGRLVAVKVLPAEVSSADRLERFEQEARASSALNHPNIVTIYDIGNVDSTTYIAMELVEGKTLREQLSTGPINLKRATQFAAQIAEGLAKAHAVGIVHRDLKPENVMITSDGYCKILDFGLAKLLPAPSNQVSELITLAKTNPGTILGTVGYMSPEQATGEEIDYRSDQFSFGLILYEMISGKRAFQRNTPVETLSAIINDDPEPLQVVQPKTPVPVRWIIERCLSKDPRDRYASTQDLAHDLQKTKDQFSEMSSTIERIEPSVQSKRRRWQWILAFSTFILGAVLGSFITYSKFRPVAREPVIVRGLTYSGSDSMPSASPDGKLIAFVSSRDGTQKIWLKDVAAGNEVALTTGPDDLAPRFSRDGSMLLFSRLTQRVWSLYKVSVLGGEPRRLVDDSIFADWSPDSSHIVFARNKSVANGRISTVHIADADGSNEREIYRSNQLLNIAFPRWSPDGKWISANRVSIGNSSFPMLLLSVDGKIKKEIPPPQRLGQIQGSGWLDANHVVYSQYESTVGWSILSGKLIRQNIETNRSEVLFWGLNLAGTLDSLAPNRIVLGSRSVRMNMREMLLSSMGISNSRWLTRGNSSDRQPAYSPDGEWIIFSSERGGNLDLWKLSVKTGATIRLTDDQQEDFDPAFTPDGKKIIWSSKRTGHFEIWTANTDGSGSRQLTNDGFDAENGTATKDGRWIVYNSYHPEKSGVWKIRVDGTGAERLFAGATELPEVSPDGQYALYHDIAKARIDVIKIANGKLLPYSINVAQRGADFATGRGRWMPDQKSIVYVDLNDQGLSGLCEYPFSTEKVVSTAKTIVLGFEEDLTPESFGISPDGSHLAVSLFEISENLMIAENIPN